MEPKFKRRRRCRVNIEHGNREPYTIQLPGRLQTSFPKKKSSDFFPIPPSQLPNYHPPSPLTKNISPHHSMSPELASDYNIADSKSNSSSSDNQIVTTTEDEMSPSHDFIRISSQDERIWGTLGKAVSEFLDGNETISYESNEINEKCVGISGKNLRNPSKFQNASLGSQNVLAKRMLNTLKKKMNQNAMIGFISIFGKPRMTLRAYEHMAHVLREISPTLFLPSSTALRRSYLSHYVNTLFVSSMLQSFPIDFSKISRHPYRLKNNSDETNCTTGINNQKLDEERNQKLGFKDTIVVLPTEWAKKDTSFLPIFRELYCIDYCRCVLSIVESIETTQIVSDPYGSFRRSRSLWAQKSGEPFPVRHGDMINIRLIPKSHGCHKSPLIFNNDKIGENRNENTSILTFKFHDVFEVAWPGTHGVNWFPDPSESDQSSMESVVRKCLEKFIEEIDENVDDNVDNSADSNTQASNEIITPRFKLRPGDLCSFLELEEISEAYGSICVLINRFDRWKDNSQSNCLVWFKTTPTYNGIQESAVAPVPIFLKRLNNSEFLHKNSTKRCLTKGKLENGKKYYIYRALLYNDDFQPRSLLFPRGSVGGFYLQPLGLSRRRRRRLHSIRPISLTPHGVSTNKVFDFVMKDIVNASTHGIDAVDANGENVRLFIEIVGFVADYPASSGVLDVLNHNSRCPCTHCCFTSRKKGSVPRYSYSRDIHYGNSCYTRSITRTMAVRYKPLSKERARKMGMIHGVKNDLFIPGKAPLFKLSLLLLNSRQVIPVDEGGQKVLSGMMDAYNNNIIAPDHLLTGIGKCVIEACFLEIQDLDVRRKFDLSICCSLRDTGMENQSTVFNYSKSSLLSLTMSTVYSIITVLPVTIRCLKLDKSLRSSVLAHTFSNLVGMCFWWPDYTFDGIEGVEFVLGKHRNEYHEELKQLASKFLEEVNLFCLHSEGKCAKVMDKPNIHRLLELVHHTIPLFHHASFVTEMVFEAFHQQFKSTLTRNSSSRAHITSMIFSLATDWFVRLSEIWSMYNGAEGAEEKKKIMDGLLNLCCGENVNEIDWDQSWARDMRINMESIILETFNGIVGKQLIKWYGNVKCDTDMKGIWEGINPSTKITNSTSCYCKMIRSALGLLRMIDGANQLIVVYKKAILRTEEEGTNFGYYSHRVLRRNDVVEVQVEHNRKFGNKVVHPCGNGKGITAFFSIGAIIGFKNSTPWLCVAEMNKLNDVLYEVEPVSEYNVALLPLDINVRKALSLHNCASTESCQLVLKQRNIKHSQTLADGGQYFILSRKNGFPPRRA